MRAVPTATSATGMTTAVRTRCMMRTRARPPRSAASMTSRMTSAGASSIARKNISRVTM
jgi:hypothetical protein